MSGRLLSRVEAAKFLGVSKSLLEKATMTDPTWQGPPVVRIGRRILYCRDDLKLWAKSQSTK